MDSKSQHTLELDKILARLADQAAFSASKELALALTPSNDPAEVRRRQKETSEARALLDMKPGLSIGGARDVRDLVRRALIDAVLEPKEMLDILATLQSARALKATITRLGERFPTLAAIVARIKDAPQLEREIQRCINERGEVVDDASPALRRIRIELRQAHDRLMTKLNELLSSSEMADVLQDPIITVRDERYVFPIRSEKRQQFHGIVHDQSASGATVFMEPLATVELNNRWRSLQIEEQQEVLRILRRLSGMVAADASGLMSNVEALAELDLAFAKANYSAAIRGVEPELRDLHIEVTAADEDIHPSAYPLYLKDARHPLLTGNVVPITVYFGGRIVSLVITGPNTGGKTVALKTVGLLCLMAQAGLHIPAAEGSAVPVFENIFADIGDEQSIEQSLSTFSSHLKNIVHILAEANDRCLVLLDELGAGTDPVEGSALALAILQYLQQRRIMTMVATHYAELKAYAYTTPGVQNASVDFDVETLSPTYHLSIGLPGRSNALAIAARLGLNPEIIEMARRMISPSQMQIETLLWEIQRERRDAEEARMAMESDRDAAARLRREIAAERQSIEDERRHILAETRAQAEGELNEVRSRLRRLMAEAESARTRSQIAAALQETKDIGQHLPELPSSRGAAIDMGEPASGSIAVGDTVWIPSLNLLGEVVAGADAQNLVEVQVGSFRTKVPAAGLEKRSPRRKAEPQPSPTVAPAAEVPLQLDLRGWRAEDVEPVLDRYLNDAYLAGLPFVRIVHGKGTGVLRQVVRDIVSRHSLVKSARSGEAGEGGDGVTVVSLAV
jgi:DNA mismatch repair protein MutS2